MKRTSLLELFLGFSICSVFFFPLNLSYLGGLFVFIEREFVGEPQIARSDPGHLVGPHGITHLSLVPKKSLIVFKSSKNKRNDI